MARTLIFDADDTLWENTVVYEQVAEDFFAWLAHPDEAHARAARAEIERAEIDRSPRRRPGAGWTWWPVSRAC